MIKIKERSLLEKPIIYTEGYLFIYNTDEQWWRHPWRFFTTKGWRHCSMVVKHNTLGLHTLVDPTMGSTQVYPMIVEDVQRDILDVIEHTRCLYFKIPLQERVVMRGIGSCVGTLKQILGICDYTVVTPKGLYKLLLNKYNAQEIQYEKS